MKKAISIIAVFFLFNIPSYSQFTVINTGTSTTLNQISIIENYIVVSGENFIAKSYNECNTLIPLTVPEPVGYYNNGLNIIDTNIFFIHVGGTSGSIDKIYKSSDGGYSWQLKFDTTNLFLKSLIFFDSLEGFATQSFYKLARTKDGGNTWTSGSYPLIITSASEIFGDSTVCVGVSERFFISYDRGNSWTGNGFLQANPRAFFILNKDTLFATSSGDALYFSYSFDSGSTWINKSFQSGIEPVGIYFKSVSEGYVVGRDQNNFGIILKTTDLGQTWSVFNTQITTTLIDIKFLNDTIALISGSGGVLLKCNPKTLTGISTILTPSFSFNIFPNPFSSSLNLQFETSVTASAQFIIFDFTGKEIATIEKKHLPKGKHQEQFNTSHLPPGLYLLIANINSQIHTFKILNLQ